MELRSTYPTLRCKEIRVFPKIRILPSGTQDLDISPRQVDAVVNNTRRRSSLCTAPTTIDTCCWMHIVYYKSVDSNPVTPSLRFVLNLLYNLFLQYSGAAAVDKIFTEATRGCRASCDDLLYLLAFDWSDSLSALSLYCDTIRYEMLF